MKITILLADDHRIVRKGLRSLLEKEENLKIVGEADTGRLALQLVLKLKPDVVVMDVSMPDLNGVDATRQIVNEAPSVKVIALSMHSDRHFVAGMLQAGARGYLLKDCAYEELVDAILNIIAGQTYLSKQIANVVVKDYIKKLSKSESWISSNLSPREREVLQLLAEGLNTKEIANRLHVSSKTVETHRLHVMNKLHIHSIAELTKFAIKEGLTSLDG